MDRRDFLLRAGVTAAAASLPVRVGAQEAAARPREASSIYVDALGYVDDFGQAVEGKYSPDPQVVEAIRQRRVDVVSQTHGNVGNGPNRYQDAVESIATTDRVIAAHPRLFAKIERASDISAARNAGRLGIIYNFQDTSALEADASRVATFAALGVRIMQLTYNKRNLAGDGCLERSNAGISDFGRQVISNIKESNVVLDLSHAGQRTQAEAIAASSSQPAITHSGCRALADLPRNTYDAEMRALSKKGGVFGIYLMPFLKIGRQAQREDLIRHVEHALNVCGEDHIGIGTDGPLSGYTIDQKARDDQRKFFEERQKLGIAAPGEGADIFNLVEGYNGPDRFDRIASDLRLRGWSSARVEKLLGGNFVRLFSEVWRG